MEQEFLVQPDECLQMSQQLVQEPEQVSNLARDQAEEALQSLAERLSQLPSSKGEIKDGFIRQKNAVSEMVQSKLHNIKNFYLKTFQRAINTRVVPQHVQDMFPPLEKAAAEILESILPEQIEMKMSAFSGAILRNRQELDKKVDEFKTKINQAQDPQALQNIVQEISLLSKQAVDSLKDQYKLQYEIDQGSMISDFDKIIKNFFRELRGFLKPTRTTLKVGEKLRVDERLSSENGIFSLVMERGFILTLYRFDEVIWRHQCRNVLRSAGRDAELILNQNGVLAVQEVNQKFSEALNVKNPSCSGDGAYLTITNAGEVKILDSGRELWTPLYGLPTSDVWKGSDSFSLRNFLVSENEVYTLLVTSECYLVLYEGSILVWFKGLRPPSARVVSCDLHLNHNGQLVSKTHFQDKLPNLVLVKPHNSYKGQTSSLSEMTESWLSWVEIKNYGQVKKTHLMENSNVLRRMKKIPPGGLFTMNSKESLNL